MCLSKKEKKPRLYKDKTKWFTGYKVMKEMPGDTYSGMYYHQQIGFYEKNKPYSAYRLHPCSILIHKGNQKYFEGFHIYRSIVAAKHGLLEFKRWHGGAPVIVKVKFKGVNAYGKEQVVVFKDTICSDLKEYAVIVARYMKIKEKVK